MLWAKETMKSAIDPHQFATLRVDELHLSRQAQVRLSDKVEIQDKGSTAFTFAVGLFAPDPRRYAVNSVSLATGLPAARPWACPTRGRTRCCSAVPGSPRRGR